MLVLTGCTGGADPNAPFSSELVALNDVRSGDPDFVPVLDGPLRLLSATPAGPLLRRPSELHVSVTFSQPMVPLGTDTVDDPTLLTLTPTVEGTLSWRGTQTLVFTPSAPLNAATAYTATLRAGLASIDGDVLAEPYRWTFEMSRPALVTSEPQRYANYVRPDQPLRLWFNQRIAASAVADHLTLREARGSRTIDLDVMQAGDSALVATPRQSLQKGTSYVLELAETLPSLDGLLLAGETTPLTFTTHADFRLEELSQPYNYAENALDRVNPAQSLTLRFSTPVAFEQVRTGLTLTPAVEPPAGWEARDAVESIEHTIQMPWAPETRYELTLNGLTDIFGQALPTTSRGFRTRAYAPSFRIPTGLMVIEATEGTVVPMHVTNIEAVNLGMQALTAEQVVPLASVYDTQHYYPYEDGSEPEPIAMDQAVGLDVPRNQRVVHPLELAPVLTNGTGIAVVRAAPRGTENNWDYRALVQVTHMGLSAKFSPHQNLIFVTDLATAQPIAEAAVHIRDAENNVLWRGTTDAEGQALTPGWSALGLESPDPWTPPTQFVFVERGEDLAFTSSLYGDGLEPYRFDVDYAWQPEARTLAGSVFTDMGLYREGETVHVKGILRQRTDADWQPIRDSVRVFIHSPRDQVLLDQRFLPSDMGTFHFDWRSPSQTDQGAYLVRVAFASDTLAATRDYTYERGDIAQGSFRIDAFRRATFSTTASSSQPYYTAGDFFEGQIEGRYLFGAVMQNQPLYYTLSRQPSRYTPPGFDGYRFGPIQANDGHRTIAQGDTMLNADGQYDVRLQLDGPSSGGPSELVWEGVITDPSEQQISGRTNKPLHPGLFYIGLRPQTTFLDLTDGDELPVDLVTVTPQGQSVATEGVTVELVRRQWSSVREVGTDGRLRWRSRYDEEVMAKQQVSTRRGQATRLKLPITEGGSYLVRATGYDVRGNLIRSEAYLYATGSGYVAWERRDDDRIDLVADRNTYQPGETAKIMVQSPYEEATALITVEREGILSSRVVTLTGSAPQIEVPLTEDYLPNAFVSVMLVHGRVAQPSDVGDPGAPSFKIGYVNLKVDAGVRRLKVAVEPSAETYRPGEEVTVDLRVTDASGKGVPAEVAFSAGDAGVLNLIGYRLPDPFDAFYGPRRLHVRTTETRANLVRQRNFGQKEEDMGGGGGEYNDGARADFRPLAHWDPAIRTDSRGRVSVTFRVPESLTTFRLMATALTADSKFGVGREDIIVTKPLVLQPALPRFARVGDRFEAGVLVTNTTGQAGTATVGVEATGLTLDGADTQAVELADGETQNVRFSWLVEVLGDATLTFDATLGSERDALVTTLPVALPTIRETFATFASTENAANEQLRIPDGAMSGAGGLKVELSSTAMVGLGGATRYLFEYPYGCLEQRTSRIRPLLAGDALLDAFDLEALGGTRDSAVETWLAKLSDYWMGEGFSLWPGGAYRNPYVESYVVLALAEARDAGFTLPLIANDAVDALEELVRTQNGRPEYYGLNVWNDTRSLALYALARHGRILDSELADLARRGALSIDGQSYLLRALLLSSSSAHDAAKDRIANMLAAQIRVEGTTAYFAAPAADDYSWIFASDTRSTAFGLSALLDYAGGTDQRVLAQRMVRYLIDTRQGGHWTSTQENAAVLDALRLYFERYEEAEPNFAAEVQLAGQSVLQEAFQGRSLDVARAEVDLDDLPSSAGPLPIAINREGTGVLYYSLALNTYSTGPVEAETRGLTVARSIRKLDAAGMPGNPPLTPVGETLTIQAGDLLQVTVRLTTPVARSYVVVDDALPAGLEALNTAFATTAGVVQQQSGMDTWWGSFNHTELRDDRVLLFADYLRRGEHTYRYVVRATTSGIFQHPPLHASLMYQPNVRGRTASSRVQVISGAGNLASQ
ncbi:MAG: alpha-2-macroglobulin family protein [Rhodothermales bacterium]